MDKIASDYFQRLFTTNVADVSEHLLNGVATCISERSNHMLLESYTKKEIISALKSMRPTKAPSEDGFPAIFFQKFWHIMGKDVCTFCLEISNNNDDVFSLNHTHVVFILKINNPVNLASFPLISYAM